jgi:hypothetical protein
MPLEHVPQDRFIINSLVRMIAASNREAKEEQSDNIAIGCGVEELVKQNLRLLSQEQASVHGWEGLLDMALRRSADQLQRELDSHRVTFDLEPYLTDARDSLEAAAKEMSGLNRKLIESREKKRIAEKAPIGSADAHRRYEVSELGLLESIEGLLATPTAGVATLNVDGIRRAFPTEGEWFPFEVRVDDFLFVIDDDGAVFISTENFPREALDRARAVLYRLAEMLYSEMPGS